MGSISNHHARRLFTIPAAFHTHLGMPSRCEACRVLSGAARGAISGLPGPHRHRISGPLLIQGHCLYCLSPTETRRSVSFVKCFEETRIRVASTSITCAASSLFRLPSTHCEWPHADEACRINLPRGANAPNSSPSGRHVYGILGLLLIQVHACAAVA